MTVFSEKVNPTFTSSDQDIIIVENYQEIFFDVFELEINGNKYVAEKVSEREGKPVLAIPVELDGQTKLVNFLVEKGPKFEIYCNKELSGRRAPKSKDVPIDIDKLVESAIKEGVGPLISIPELKPVVNNLDAVKESAAQHLKSIHEEYSRKEREERERAKRDRVRDIEKITEKVRSELVNEFLSIADSIKEQLIDNNTIEYKQLEESLHDSFQELKGSLDAVYSKDIDSLAIKFQENVDTFIDEVYKEKLTSIIENKIQDVERALTARYTLLENDTSKNIDLKIKDISGKIINNSKELTGIINKLEEQYKEEILFLKKENVNINDNITKSINKALSRIGNVKTVVLEKISEDIKTIEGSFKEQIEKQKNQISEYYNNKIADFQSNFAHLNEEFKKEIVDLITESEKKLLNEIQSVEPTTLILKEKKGKTTNVTLGDIRKELETSISGRFSKEIVSLKRLIEMTSGGGGGGAGGGGSQTLVFDENTATLSISNGNSVSLLSLSGDTVAGGLNNVDGGRADSVYLPTQTLDGGDSIN